MRGKWGQRLFLAGLFTVIAVFTALMFRHALRRTVHITLPAEEAGYPLSDGDGAAGGLVRLEVTPETVQAAVAVMRRPSAYCRTISLTRYWSGGRGFSTAAVTVSEPWTRVDMTAADGTVRHSITNGAVSYIWYNDERRCARTPAGTITADDEQQIPTYEDLLSLPVERIAAADYRLLDELNCVYVETTEEEGYQERWWIGVETGLLAAAERLFNGQVFYRMEAAPDNRRPATAAFTLPDGTVLQTVT